MKTPYEQIKTIIEAGFMAVGELRDGEFIIISAIQKDNNNNNLAKTSHSENSIKKCRNSIGFSFANDEWINKLIDKVYPLAQKTPVYPVGTKVRVLENIKECSHYEKWDYGINDMISKIFTIKEVSDNYIGVGYLLDNNFHIPSYAICPVWDEEEILEVSLEDIAKKFGVDKIKIKTNSPKSEKDLIESLTHGGILKEKGYHAYNPNNY